MHPLVSHFLACVSHTVLWIIVRGVIRPMLHSCVRDEALGCQDGGPFAKDALLHVWSCWGCGLVALIVLIIIWAVVANAVNP